MWITSFKIFLVALLLCPAIASAEEGWGALKGRFVLVGEPPKLAQLDPGNDQVCCKAEPRDESLVLGEEKAIANVVVYLRPPRGTKTPVHPSYKESAKETVEFDNKGCAFMPHVALVRTGQRVLLKNTDATNHSIKGALGDEEFNFMLAAGGEEELSFDLHQRLPRPVGCSIHPFMRGYLLVRNDPYMAVSDREGNFEITHLPAGEHEFQFWHERSGYLKNAKHTDGDLGRRGRITVSIPTEGEVDLGVIEVDAAILSEPDE